MSVRRRRPRLILVTSLVFCAVFFAALSSLVSPGARHAPEPAPTAGLVEARPSDKTQQPEGVSRTAAGQPARGKERAGRQPLAEAASGGDPDAAPGAPKLRPMPTATVTIDAVTGQLATRDCPTVSRMTYPAGGEPRSYCTARHKTKVDVQPEPERPKGSRLKSIAKRLAAPFD